MFVNPNAIEPTQTARAIAILLAASAFDVAPLELFCSGFTEMAVYLQYIRGGAAGAVTLNIEYSPYSVDQAVTPDWYRLDDEQAAAAAAGADTISLAQASDLIFTPVTAAIEAVKLGSFDINGTERVRIPCAESGNAGSPGTGGIIVIFSGGLA